MFDNYSLMVLFKVDNIEISASKRRRHNHECHVHYTRTINAFLKNNYKQLFS